MRVRLVLTSATVLLVELLLIRWISANVVYVRFFNNLLLLSSFLGIGIGILPGRRVRPSAAVFFAPISSALVLFIALAQVNVKYEPGDGGSRPGRDGSSTSTSSCCRAARD